MSREFTHYGHSVRCGLCDLRVYGLWVSKEAPPIGCSDGLDVAPWSCSHVLNSIAMGVARVDYMDGEWQPHHEHIRKVIGDKRFEEIVAYIRSNNGPPKAGRRQAPNYDAVRQ